MFGLSGALLCLDDVLLGIRTLAYPWNRLLRESRGHRPPVFHTHSLNSPGQPPRPHQQLRQVWIQVYGQRYVCQRSQGQHHHLPRPFCGTLHDELGS